MKHLTVGIFGDMELAKKLRCPYYDFWGVAPLSQPSAVVCFHNYCWETNHPWAGITRFKAGFGGQPIEYGQAVDVVLRPTLYSLYKLAKIVF